MNTYSLLHIAASAATIIVCITVLAFSIVAYRRIHVPAFAFLMGASVIRLISEVGARPHPAWLPAGDSAAWYVFYLVSYTIAVVLWGVGVILLIRYALEKRAA